jgi:acyl carrier protein
LLCDDAVQMAVLPIAWDRVLGHVPAGSEPPFYSELATEVREREVLAAQPANRDNLLSELSQASAETRRDLVSRFLEEHVRRVLGIGKTDRLNPDEPLAQMGLDSLMGIELKSRVGTELGIDIPLQKFVGASSLTGLASLLLEQLTLASLSSAALDESEEMEEIAL